MTRRDLLLTNVPRRGLRRLEAAAYVGVGESKFDEMVHDGRMPKPIRVDGCVIWDIRHLDLAFDALAEKTPEREDSWGDV
jgi:predicted DNA-binding transcriptional regulator AlpA